MIHEYKDSYRYWWKIEVQKLEEPKSRYIIDETEVVFDIWEVTVYRDSVFIWSGNIDKQEGLTLDINDVLREMNSYFVSAFLGVAKEFVEWKEENK